MIVIDSSAIVAILRNEPEKRALSEIVVSADVCYMSAATLLETRIVLFRRFGEGAELAIDAFVENLGVKIIDVTRETADIAFDAFRHYGKGMGHAASLNFGDCFSYALAKQMDLPLLYKGNDFPQTDIPSAAIDMAI